MNESYTRCDGYMLSNDVYITSADGLLYIREKLFSQNIIQNINNIYGNLANLIPKCLLYPFPLITNDTINDFSNPKSIRIGILEKFEADFPELSIKKYKPALLKEKFKILAEFRITYNKSSYDFRDLNPFTEYSIYLPFFGFIPIDSDIAINHMIIIKYYRIVASGSVCVKVGYLKNSEDDNSYFNIYEDETVVAIEIPIFGSDGTALRNAIINLGSMAIGAIVGGKFGGVQGAVAGMGMGQSFSNTFTSTRSEISTSHTVSDVSRKRNKDSGRLQITKDRKNSDITESTKNYESESSRSYTNPSATAREIYNCLANFAMLSTTTNHGTVGGGNFSFFSHRKPYMSIKKFNSRYPEDNGHHNGYIVNETKILGNLKGYTKVSSIHLELPCTASEIGEIENLLYGGVVITSNTVPEPPVEPEPPAPEPPAPEPIEPIEPETKWLSPWSGAFKVTSTYGEKRTYTATDGKVYTDVHKGLDMVGIGDITVYSIAEGTVEHIGWQNPSDPLVGFGYYCRINTNGKLFYYGHMRADSSTLKVGDKVSKGTKIGIMGSTGQVTGAHLHLEVRANTSPSSYENICSYTLLPNKIGTYE